MTDPEPDSEAEHAEAMERLTMDYPVDVTFPGKPKPAEPVDQ